jgi:DNA replication protein DnaC
MLKNLPYTKIMNDYEERRFQVRHEALLRYNEVKEAIPEYTKLEEALAANSLACAKRLLSQTTGSTEGAALEALTVDRLSEENSEISRKKAELLIRHGFPADYTEPVYFCPDCKDTGYIGTEKCHCLKQTIVNFLYSQSNLSTILEAENFSTFQLSYYPDDRIEESTGLTSRDNIQRVLAECHSFIRNFDQKPGGLLLYGNTGVGKTFLCNCIAKVLLDASHTVVYLTAFQLFDVLEKYKFNRLPEEYSSLEEKVHYILDADLLIIDDLGTEATNSFLASQLYLCVNERLLKQKATIISTNLSLDDLNHLYSERVFSRIISSYRLLKITGTDIRLKKAVSGVADSQAVSSPD